MFSTTHFSTTFCILKKKENSTDENLARVVELNLSISCTAASNLRSGRKCEKFAAEKTTRP